MAVSADNSTPTAQIVTPRRRWYQFTLRTAGVWMVLLCLLLGSFAWWRDRAERQRKVVEELRGLGVRVEYRYFSLSQRQNLQTETYYSILPEEEFFLCSWIRRCLGDDFLCEVDSADLTNWGYPVNPPEAMRRAMPLIQKCPNIKRLRLAGNAIRGTDLAKLPFIETLEELWIVSDGRGSFADDDLEVLEQASCLNRIRLARQPIGDAGIKHLGECRQLRVMDLDGTEVGNDGLQHLCGLTELAELNLSRTHVTDAGLKHLRGLNKLSNLNLQEDAVDGEGLAQIGVKPELRMLNLEGTKATDDSLRHFQQFPKLYNIQLGRTRITGAGVSHIAGLKSLQFVRFDGCPITDEIDSKMEIPEGWQVLSFARTGVTDEGLRSLKLPSTLRSFHLAATSVTDKTLDHLQKLPNLNFLSVNNTQVTSAGIKRFKTRQAGCEVRD